jgi:hypothetical protein
VVGLQRKVDLCALIAITIFNSTDHLFHHLNAHELSTFPKIAITLFGPNPRRFDWDKLQLRNHPTLLSTMDEFLIPAKSAIPPYRDMVQRLITDLESLFEFLKTSHSEVQQHISELMTQLRDIPENGPQSDRLMISAPAVLRLCLRFRLLRVFLQRRDLRSFRIRGWAIRKSGLPMAARAAKNDRTFGHLQRFFSVHFRAMLRLMKCVQFFVTCQMRSQFRFSGNTGVSNFERSLAGRQTGFWHRRGRGMARRGRATFGTIGMRDLR